MLRKIAVIMMALMLALPMALANELPEQEAEKVEDFEITLINGETFKLSEQEGKIVIVTLWATWCPSCVASMPALQQITDTHPEDVVILAVECGEPESEVADFVNAYGYTFAFAADEEMDFIMNRFPTSAIPYSVFIDSEGYVYASHLGGGAGVYDQFDAIIAEMTPQEN